MEKQKLGRPFSSGKESRDHLVYFLRSVARRKFHASTYFSTTVVLLPYFQPIILQKSSPNCQAVLALAEIFAEG